MPVRSSRSVYPFAQTLTPREAIREADAPPQLVYSELQRGKILARKTPDGRWEICRLAFNEWLVGYEYRRRRPAVTIRSGRTNHTNETEINNSERQSPQYPTAA